MTEIADFFPWGVILDVMLVILLVATIIYALTLNRRLSLLRSDGVKMEEFIQRLNSASQRAEAALTGIKVTAENAQDMMAENAGKAAALRDELLFLIDRGEKLSDDLAVSRPISDSAGADLEAALDDEMREKPRPKQVPSSSRRAAPSAGQSAQKSQAERDLLRALRDVK
jgi:hypothetical protein